VSALVLYADGETDLGPEHLDLSLEVGGEEIVLSSPDGRAAHVVFGPLSGDVAAARVTDCFVGAGCWGYRFAGSPGATNAPPERAEVTLLEAGATWRVYDGGGPPPAGWHLPDFDDSGWWSGAAPLGYGNTYVVTEVGYGDDEENRHITTWFRTTFEAGELGEVEHLTVSLLRDDGAAVYLNGVEILRDGLPDGALDYQTLASEVAGQGDEDLYHPLVLSAAEVSAAALVEGTNYLAVEVHQAGLASHDLGLDVGLAAAVAIPAAPPAPVTLEGEHDPTAEEVAGLEDPSASLFTPDVIHAIELVVPASSARALAVDPYVYQPASVTLEGQRVALVGVRLRGKYGSYRDLEDKPKLKIDFNRFVEDQRFFGLESLSLNNSVVDCSYLKEFVSYAAFAQAGLPTPRLAFTDVTLNGEDYGLYQVLDSQDDVWLERHYSDPSGNLYDGKYAYEWPWEFISFVDFWPGMDQYFQLEEGVDVGLADVEAITAVNVHAGGGDTWYEELGGLLDLEQWHRHIATEQWTGHLDGYWLNTNNYRVYFDPADGLAEFITWDLDYSILQEAEWGMNFNRPAGTIAQLCRFDAGCFEAQRAAALLLLEDLDVDALAADFEAAAALIGERALSDPRRECGERDVTLTQNTVRRWIAERSDEVAAWWAD